jgi:hypothetical protein
LPNLQEIRDRFIGAKYFTKMDLRNGYYNIRVTDESIPLTAFNCALGHYEFKVMNFGLCNAPATFMRLMNNLFGKYYGKFVVCYLDDLLIYSSTLELHIQHVEEIFKVLALNSLPVKVSKCIFASDEVPYCGHIVSYKGISVDQSKLQGLYDTPIPLSKHEVMCFLGSVTYFKDFIPELADLTSNLSDLLRKFEKFKWSERETFNFHTLIFRISTAPILAFFDPNLPIVVLTDASSYGIGGWLAHTANLDNFIKFYDNKNLEGSKLHQIAFKELNLKPITFWSRKMTPAERNYAVHEQETLAIVEIVKKYSYYLSHQQFLCLSDHRSLTYLNTQQHLSKRQLRWIQTIQEHPFIIKYIPGKWNQVADMLSRNISYAPLCESCKTSPIVNSITLTLSDNKFEELLRESLKIDDLYLEIKQQIKQSLERYNQQYKDFELKNDLLYKDNKLYIPNNETLKLKILHYYHDGKMGGHTSWNKLFNALRTRYWWPKSAKNCKFYVQSCDQCQRNKYGTKMPYGKINSLKMPQTPWEMLQIDFAELPTSKEGYNMVFVVIDAYSRYSYFIPTYKTVTAAQVADLLIKKVILVHGLPKKIISDLDSKFTSKFWKSFLKQLDISADFSTVRHHQSNGLVERTIRTLKELIRCYINFNHNNWCEFLPYLQFAYNNSYSQTTGFTPHFLNYGIYPNSLINPKLDDLTNESIQDKLEKFNLVNKIVNDNVFLKQHYNEKYYSKHHQTPPVYKVGSPVLLSTLDLPLISQKFGENANSKLLPRYIGPFSIVKVGPKPENYELNIPKSLGINPTVHSSLLAPYYAPNKEFPTRKVTRPLLPIINNDNEEEYYVDEILDCKLRYKKPYYYVKWTGYPVEEATWEPLESVKDTIAYHTFVKNKGDKTMLRAKHSLKGV